jgi:RNA polymerase sigma-70 factor (ECF subfamily)
MDKKKTSDEELVLYIQRHAGAGFEEVIDRYQDKLLRYVATLCRDRDRTQDVVQETFISAYQNINSFNTNRKFSSWIYRIAHNKAINEWRKNKNQISLSTITEAEGKYNATEISKEIDQKQVHLRVKYLISVLPEKYREPLVLRHFEEKSYEEISDILKIPKSTVGVRIKRGVAIIKRTSNIKIEDYL